MIPTPTPRPPPPSKREHSAVTIMVTSSCCLLPKPAPLTSHQSFGHIQEYLTNLLANHPDQIDHITSYFDKRVDRLISQDKRTAFAAIALKGDGDQTLKDFRAIKVQLAGAGRMFPGVSTQIAGGHGRGGCPG